MARTAAPVYPNEGLRHAYQNELVRTLERTRDLIEPVFIEAWNDLDIFQPGRVEQAFDSGLLLYGLPHPQLVMDASYTDMIISYERRLAEALTLLDKEAGQLAGWFAAQATGNASNALKHNLSSVLNVTVGLPFTQALRAEVEGIVKDNVTLISNLSQKYTDQVAATIMESAERGRDLHYLQQALTERFGVAGSRAALIARDQNNKATAAIDRRCKLDLGITQSVWVHTPGSRMPRPDHEAANGQVYDTANGIYFASAGGFVLPGEEINCGCISRAYLPNNIMFTGLKNAYTMGLAA